MRRASYGHMVPRGNRSEPLVQGHLLIRGGSRRSARIKLINDTPLAIQRSGISLSKIGSGAHDILGDHACLCRPSSGRYLPSGRATCVESKTRRSVGSEKRRRGSRALLGESAPGTQMDCRCQYSMHRLPKQILARLFGAGSACGDELVEPGSRIYHECHSGWCRWKGNQQPEQRLLSSLSDQLRADGRVPREPGL